MKKNKGAQRKHWSENARLSAWYKLLRKRSCMTNAQLNHFFGWRSGQYPKSNEGRCMTFYRIESHNQSPQGRDLRWRDMAEIIEAVDQEKPYQGLKEIYASSFWDLIKINQISFVKLREKLNTIFIKHQLIRVDKRKDIELYDLLLKQYGESQLYLRALELCLSRMDDIDALEFCWLLYLEAKALNSAVMPLLEGLLDHNLNEFFDEVIGNFTTNDFYKKATDDMRLITIILSKSDLNKIELLKRECREPIFCN